MGNSMKNHWGSSQTSTANIIKAALINGKKVTHAAVRTLVIVVISPVLQVWLCLRAT